MKTLAFGLSSQQGTWPVQEDGYFADPQGGRFLIADGFGGRGAGDMAAKTAIQELKGARGNGNGTKPGELREWFLTAHQAILRRNEGKAPAFRGGSSLLAAFLRKDGHLEITQCGSCAALLVRGGRLLPLLLPQGPPREEFQAQLPDSALGLGEAPVPESRVLAMEAGDILVLASGGVEWDSDQLRMDLLAQLSVRAPGEDLSSLSHLLLENGSLSSQSWNRTLLLVEKLPG